MSVPLIEDGSGTSDSGSDGFETTMAGSDGGSAGPSITFHRSGGSTTTLHTEDLVAYATLVQTFLLLAVFYMEVTE